MNKIEFKNFQSKESFGAKFLEAIKAWNDACKLICKRDYEVQFEPTSRTEILSMEFFSGKNDNDQMIVKAVWQIENAGKSCCEIPFEIIYGSLSDSNNHTDEDMFLECVKWMAKDFFKKLSYARSKH